VELHALAQWLKSYHIKTVAMESTGVYWMPLFEELERQGFECLLISSRSLRRVAGRKSDISDAQWIQTLHTYGLLEGSFRPQGELVSLRTLLRHRNQLVEHRSPHIQHMQKALLQMNVQLSQAVTDVTGMTGLKIIRAILAGEGDPQILAALREPGCKKSAEEIGKAITGAWRDEHLFVLQQSVKQAECVFGVFYRRLRARLGPSQATVATAHAIARVVYRMLKYQVEYEPLNVNEYQRQDEAQQIKYLKKRAAKFGFQLLPT
jgi:hypothetical protein